MLYRSARNVSYAPETHDVGGLKQRTSTLGLAFTNLWRFMTLHSEETPEISPTSFAPLCCHR